MGSTPQHWDAAYAQGDTTRGWYQEHARTSLCLLHEAVVTRSASILDVGGGASVFVDDLLADGFTDITVLDHSPVGLDTARHRLGNQAATVDWVVSDLLSWSPPRHYDVWHDRAVLHFLLTPDERARYVEVLTAATAIGSLVIIGAFSPTGPTMCSGLPVERYDAGGLDDLLGPAFHRIAACEDVHVKPGGSTQDYLWWVGRRIH
ncbi:MAG: class I SAM-dependent methyltransferase [Actinomycetota bacterium]